MRRPRFVVDCPGLVLLCGWAFFLFCEIMAMRPTPAHAVPTLPDLPPPVIDNFAPQVEKAWAHMQDGRYDKGAEVLQRYLDKTPEDAAAWCNLGLCQKELQDAAGAKASLDRVFEPLTKDDPEGVRFLFEDEALACQLYVGAFAVYADLVDDADVEAEGQRAGDAVLQRCGDVPGAHALKAFLTSAAGDGAAGAAALETLAREHPQDLLVAAVVTDLLMEHPEGASDALFELADPDAAMAGRYNRALRSLKAKDYATCQADATAGWPVADAAMKEKFANMGHYCAVFAEDLDTARAWFEKAEAPDTLHTAAAYMHVRMACKAERWEELLTVAGACSFTEQRAREVKLMEDAARAEGDCPAP